MKVGTEEDILVWRVEGGRGRKEEWRGEEGGGSMEIVGMVGCVYSWIG